MAARNRRLSIVFVADNVPPMSNKWVGASVAGLGTSAVVSLCLACGSVPAKGDAAMESDSSLDSLQLTASPSSFLLHANDTREALFTITNPSSKMAGPPLLEATGLTLGTMTFPSNTNTCTSGLAPGASCTIVGQLTATTAGEVMFDVSASASSVDRATASLAMNVMPACPANCGPNGTANCCNSAVVPGNATGSTLAGAVFYREYDLATDNAFPLVEANAATVSNFRLDTYEVTVGRFRAFVNAGKGIASAAPAAGAGAHAAIPGSGWDAGWNSSLPANAAMLTAGLKCSTEFPERATWTDAPGANEALPINCLSWYLAFAFCIWDGGYLPTHAEWNYAAVGGSEHRAYPWSAPAGSVTIDCSYANHFPGPAGQPYCVNGTTGGTNRVGSESPKGDSRWGHSDLAGNVAEWNLDWYADEAPTPCNDCANLVAATYHVAGGGSFMSAKANLRSAWRNLQTPATPFTAGVRCARTP
jgi:formylglycine-generating enzyme